MPAAGLRPAIPASEWPLAYALYWAFTGISCRVFVYLDVHGSWYNYENNQQDATLWVNPL